MAFILLSMLVTPRMIDASTNTVFVFGDNLQKKGLGGQAAVCRPFVDYGKAFGIPTKRKPSNNEDAFFSDRHDEICSVSMALKEIDEMHAHGKDIFFLPGIGEGRARLPSRSPHVYKMITTYILERTRRPIESDKCS